MIGTCKYCGKLLDHFYPDCGQQPSEAPQSGGAAGALPVVNEALADIEQVSADLEECSSLDLNEWGDRVGEALEVIRAHLSQLTAEVERLRANGAAKLSTIHALCDDEERLKMQARLDALLEVRKALPSTGHVKIMRLETWLDAEIARLLAALRGLVERLHKAAEGHAETHGERGFCAGLRSGAHLLTELIEQTDLSEDAQ